ncbi:MAG: hypothetical protein WBL25_02655, partial [Anaerolineales bacterium]
VINCVTVGRGVDVRNGVLLAIIEFIISSGDDVAGKPGSTSDTLEQPAATINRDNKNNRIVRL